ncbi:hypothetical protein LXA43DRAFT_451549 [Ganoderma leucocontextum]|nr:hypothetical protein LXA43DRAFT_451549 [Ganoderma leucocontextum]
MYVFNGKINWFESASSECFTLVFPAGFALNDPVSAHWQWSVDPCCGKEKVNTSRSGIITAVYKIAEQYRLTIPFDVYTFEVTVAADGRSATLSNQQDAPTTLTLSYSDCIQIPTTVVYTGKLTYAQYAKDEMITLVLPAGFSPDAPVGLYYQFTVDAKGVSKRNQVDIGTLSGVEKAANGTVTAVFKASYYQYQFTFSVDETISVSMSAADSLGPHTIPLQPAPYVKSPVGRKKALIARFNDGADSGIFLVKEMLTKYLGFAAADVEMLYYDVDAPNGAKSLTGGHTPPTATHFKQKFAELLSGARPGDVRFLYVDAQGTQKGGEDCKDDGKDGGYAFAQGDCGSKTELVTNGWISEAIRKGLKPGVNLTILAPSCLGGGIIDTTTATPGLLLAGCHETQSTTKALKVGDQWVDPWTYAITKVIALRVKRGVPTYTALFDEAKAFVKRLVDCGCELDRNKYYGPSRDERHPEARNLACPCHHSHQDPQLIFNDGFINPDNEKFLFPIATHTACGCGAAGKAKVVRYPRDE